MAIYRRRRRAKGSYPSPSSMSRGPFGGLWPNERRIPIGSRPSGARPRVGCIPGKGDGSCSRGVVTYESAAWLDMPGKVLDVETASLEFMIQAVPPCRSAIPDGRVEELTRPAALPPPVVFTRAQGLRMTVEPHRPRRIVVIDHDLNLMAFLVATLRDAGHCVFAAQDGDSACELAFRFPTRISSSRTDGGASFPTESLGRRGIWSHAGV